MEQTQIYFSIIIPSYNRPTCLQKCLRSLTQLQYPRDQFEVIVVDDGSAVPIESIVASLQKLLTITLIRQANSGPAQARNRGAAQAKGTFLVFTDDDCEPTPNWLQAIETQLKQLSDALIGGQTQNALPENPYSTASQLLIDYLYTYYNAAGAPNFFASNNFTVPAEMFRKLGGFDSRFPIAAGEDREFCDRWLQQKYRMIYAPEVQIKHAHNLSLRSFWQQHFNYGRGAFWFHQSRAQRRQEPIKVEPLAFYLKLLSYPFRSHHPLSAMRLAELLFLSQFANALGFFWERYRFQSSTQFCSAFDDTQAGG